MKIFPKSIFGRFILIILLPIIIIQLVIIIVFYQRHWENVSNNMHNNLISEIITVKNFYQKYQNQEEILNQLATLNLNVVVLDEKPIMRLSKDLQLKSFLKKLRNKGVKISGGSYIESRSKIRFFLILDDSQILQIDFFTKRIKNPTTYIFVLWIVGVSLLFGLISILFMKNQIKSIVNLSNIAKEFGKSGKIENFEPSGAMEVRYLGVSFLKMCKKLEKQIKYRTELLAHIAHDLRTPITRIKLKIALLKEKDEEINYINKNIEIIDSMIKQYLSYAKQGGNEKIKEVDIILLIKEICTNLSDKRIIFENDNILKVKIRENAIERAIYNIIGNALKYSKKIVKVFANIADDKDIVIVVDDDGPGIEEKDFSSVFKPFHKLNNKNEGYGLGLAIAKDIVKIHGGKIFLGHNEYKGLRVTIKFPK
ncbi:MAG: two-component system osmolarity sensor histidine kinase EnvZ [Candidatus Midichloriaceae bacterium]|jgi:two-component system osmolarity sensor histidine kinase EnvZ